MKRLQVWLDGGMTVGMRGAGDSCVVHDGMLGIFILIGEEAYGILGGGEEVGTLGGGGGSRLGHPWRWSRETRPVGHWWGGRGYWLGDGYGQMHDF